MDNILQGIIQSEEEALRIEAEAKQEALSIITEARKKAEVIIEEALSQGEEITDSILEKAKSEALEERTQKASVLQSVDEQKEMKLREKLEEAVSFIVRKVVNKSWQ